MPRVLLAMIWAGVTANTTAVKSNDAMRTMNLMTVSSDNSDIGIQSDCAEHVFSADMPPCVTVSCNELFFANNTGVTINGLIAAHNRNFIVRYFVLEEGCMPEPK